MSSLHAFHAAASPGHTPGDSPRGAPTIAKAGSTRELAHWPATGEPVLCITLEDPDAPGPLESPASAASPAASPAAWDDLVAPTTAAGLHLAHGDDARDTRLRPGESELIPGTWETEVRDPRPFLRVAFQRERARATLEAVHLGSRELRETHAAPLGLLYVPTGRVHARTTGEDEPFELGPGDGIWIEDARPNDEWDLLGQTDDATLLWVRIHLT